MYFIYILRSAKTGRRYIGSTSDVESRLAKHNSGATISTRGGRPWTVHHTESFATKEEALRREKFLKSGRGREEMKRNGW